MTRPESRQHSNTVELDDGDDFSWKETVAEGGLWFIGTVAFVVLTIIVVTVLTLI